MLTETLITGAGYCC